MFRPLGVIFRSSFGTYFYITFLSYFSFALGIPYALQVKLRRMEHNLLVLFVRKIINVLSLWLVLLVGLPPVWGCCTVCVFLFAAIFVFLLVSSLVFESVL